MRIASPGPTSARVTIVRISSLPLPQRIQSGSTPSTSPARRRKLVASGSGYFASPWSSAPFTALEAWKWTDRHYAFTIPGSIMGLASVTIDPLRRTADMDRENDRVELPEGAKGFTRP